MYTLFAENVFMDSPQSSILRKCVCSSLAAVLVHVALALTHVRNSM